MELKHITSVGGTKSVYFATPQTAVDLAKFVQQVLDSRIGPNTYRVTLQIMSSVVPLYELLVTDSSSHKYVAMNAGIIALSVQHGLRSNDLVSVEDKILDAVLHDADHFKVPDDFDDIGVFEW